MNELHPIQLHEIVVSQISCVINDPVAAKEFEGEIDLAIQSGTSDIEPGDSHVAVGIKATVTTVKKIDDKSIFEIFVDLNGQFIVDLERFKFEHLEEWSRTNAPFLLIPYVREHVYGMALRAGISGLILPLLIQPRKLPSNEK
ncbi:protein-export chaperone SecB [Variovorax paradoxus]|uniref:protein-export chaperone SecB n=1 Tax=Variovorax paradoxus TaxID=34073 RepID=UPI00286595BF|nr:protein-export chaperone SecB [Variovorax paradoxus]MDR6453883.1 preprotein translocase subunit SecB [Variovorax paradoxus]